MKFLSSKTLLFAVGIVLGYCLVQGLSYLSQNFLWALFYRG